jgi:hypothetical protein
MLAVVDKVGLSIYNLNVSLSQCLFGSAVIDVGSELSDLGIQARLGLCLKLGKVSLEVGLLPVGHSFGAQGSLGDECSVVKKSFSEGYSQHSTVI